MRYGNSLREQPAILLQVRFSDSVQCLQILIKDIAPQRQPPPPGHLGAKRNARDALGPVPESASKRREAEDNAVERRQNDAAGPSTPGPSQQGGTALREFGRLRNFRLAPSGLRNVTRPGDDDEGESSEEE